MEATDNKKKIEAYFVLLCSLLFFLFFCISAVYLMGDEPGLDDLSAFTGKPDNPEEVSSRYSNHIKFTIEENQFYYSGENFEEVKNIVFAAEHIDLKAYRNHGIDDSIYVVYTLSHENEAVVTFVDSANTEDNIILLLFICAILSLAGAVYGFIQVKKHT